MAGDPHILLVDDERDIRDPLAAYLSRNGLRVTKAGAEPAARQLLNAYFGVPQISMRLSELDREQHDAVRPASERLRRCRRE